MEIHSDYLDNVLNNQNNKVLIITIQKLVIKKKNPEHFEILMNQINFIMFDEGHREPALESC
ncbi:hypothetical protein [Peribacillus frigoritolerans]|uniref:hypothetical protein n=1 Tax=Peribacillus frigoritolerans TaxID=450367 RepID=UPI003306881D